MIFYSYFLSNQIYYQSTWITIQLSHWNCQNSDPLLSPLIFDPLHIKIEDKWQVFSTLVEKSDLSKKAGETKSLFAEVLETSLEVSFKF